MIIKIKIIIIHYQKNMTFHIVKTQTLPSEAASSIASGFVCGFIYIHSCYLSSHLSALAANASVQVHTRADPHSE